MLQQEQNPRVDAPIRKYVQSQPTTVTSGPDLEVGLDRYAAAQHAGDQAHGKRTRTGLATEQRVAVKVTLAELHYTELNAAEPVGVNGD